MPVSNLILKGITSSIADPLSHIFNKSILSGIFPKQMKIGKVIHLYKKKKKKKKKKRDVLDWYRQLPSHFFTLFSNLCPRFSKD